MEGRIVRLNRSNGGVPKLPVSEVRVSAAGMEGDRQRDRRFHGGPKRALCLYSLELIEALQREGHPIAPGTAGENVTIAGLDWTLIGPGVRLSLGGVEVQLTTFTVPCKNIRHSFIGEDFTRISEKLHPGWSRVYAQVLNEGLLQVGERVTLSPR